ncbi:hypothetical protein WJX72_006716 [[Myrmecia] bisecta]|uniref:MYND-type domain-containing protein n=1 Tax=[Myrmecia] bisecta TaxID=41462 RepID=A0AAW1R6X2_9CHLO
MIFRVVLTDAAGLVGLYGYCERNGFMDFLQVEELPSDQLQRFFVHMAALSWFGRLLQALYNSQVKPRNRILFDWSRRRICNNLFCTVSDSWRTTHRNSRMGFETFKAAVFKLRKCAGCKQAWYCSAECQASRWKQHKLFCKTLTQAADEHGSVLPTPAEMPRRPSEPSAGSSSIAPGTPSSIPPVKLSELPDVPEFLLRPGNDGPDMEFTTEGHLAELMAVKRGGAVSADDVMAGLIVATIYRQTRILFAQGLTRAQAKELSIVGMEAGVNVRLGLPNAKSPFVALVVERAMERAWTNMNSGA